MAATYRIGLDLGSTASKAVLLAPDDSVLGRELCLTASAPGETATRLVAALTVASGVDESRVVVVATGYGRSQAGTARRAVTEITCHARGIRHLHPDARGILDVGGQDAKAIRLGPDGAVEDFAMNDRCAAGTGRFLEVAAARFGLETAALSGFCLDDPTAGGDFPPFEISSTCVVFAESELVGLTARGVPARESLRAVHRAIAQRIKILLKQAGTGEPLYFTGGVAKNETMLRAIAEAAGVGMRRAEMAQFTGALGAALLG